jgi:hypothetical protein
MSDKPAPYVATADFFKAQADAFNIVIGYLVAILKEQKPDPHATDLINMRRALQRSAVLMTAELLNTERDRLRSLARKAAGKALDARLAAEGKERAA